MLPAVAIIVNGVFAAWLFATAAIWGPDDYVGGAIITIPPLLAIIALSTPAHSRSAKRTKSEDEDER